ncbi:MAG: addiction module toxin, HicA family [Limisphaerales bacterium]
MKRIDLIRPLESQGRQFIREAGRHAIHQNPCSRRASSVPRPREILELMARKICKDLDILLP